MFGRRVRRDDGWDGVVTRKKIRSPNGQIIFHVLEVALSDGGEQEIRVHGGFWRTVSVGDRLIKEPGEKAPARAA
jgi:hypothetical protein